MANRRMLVKRRKAAKNISKITKTMQLIATARFQAAHNRAVASQPYTEKLAEMVGDLGRAAKGIDHPLMQQHEGVKRTALIILTSSRGFCGGYNANVLKAAIAGLEEAAADSGQVDTYVVGKKGISYFNFNDLDMSRPIDDIGETPRFEQVEPIANELMDAFAAGEIGSVKVAYMKFYSAGKQRPVIEQLLPLAVDAQSESAPEGADKAKPAREVQYEFSPAPKELLDELLPATVRVRLYQSFTDAAVSEQLARMVAMKAATDAAGDMIKRLTQQYNRARQTHITMELLDIVGGAAALG